MKNHPIKEEVTTPLLVLNTAEMIDKEENKVILSKHRTENKFVVEALVRKTNRGLIGLDIFHTHIKNSTEDTMASVGEDFFSEETNAAKKVGTVKSGKVVLNITIGIQIAPDPDHHEDRMEEIMNV